LLQGGQWKDQRAAKQEGKQLQVSNEKREEEADKGKKTKATEQQCTDRERAKKTQETQTEKMDGKKQWEETVGCELERIGRIRSNLVRFIGAYRIVVGGSLFSK
jgi:hypothetical protein